MTLLNLLASLLLPALGLALYRLGYETGRQAAREDWDDDNDDGPIVMEHCHGGEDDV